MDSPVSIDWSSVTKSESSRTSAGTMPQSDSCTTSPGTKSDAGRSDQARSRSTRAHGARRWRSKRVSRSPGTPEPRRADIDQQERCHHHRFQPLAGRELQHDGGFEHPRRRRSVRRSGCTGAPATSFGPTSAKRRAASEPDKPVGGAAELSNKPCWLRFVVTPATAAASN